LKSGSVTFVPSSLCSLGGVGETYQNGHIIILKLNDHKIKVGDKLIVFHDGMYTHTIIKSIQINDNNVDEAQGCEVGIKTNIPIRKKSMIYLKE
jgi:translation initiation factor IF-2